ncbi:MAG: 2-C-methyl-D-erythritol 2,4-cyclodiphosphate synthase [Planctomycetota bacterium]
MATAKLAKGKMPQSPTYRVGFGTDLHRLEGGRPLVIGGVSIPASKGAVGHSDADVALHALADALLGAVAQGDIGELFPDDDEAHRGLDSAHILREALARVRGVGGEVVNVDLVVELEEPRLLPHRDKIRQRIAELLEIAVGKVSFKAKSGEGLGPIGEGEAVSAQAVVLLEFNTRA